MDARIDFADFRAGDTFSPFSGTVMKSAALNHPNGATGYRIEHAGKSLCYVTDTEHVVGKLDDAILGLIQGADLVIYDSTYTDKEFPNHIGWGHSTWEEGVRLCIETEAKTLAIFHHDPDHEDSFMEKVESEARQLWSGAIVARENMRLNLI
jgi:phosphoribosyl 1,2-cyclic phosphodiesterase